MKSASRTIKFVRRSSKPVVAVGRAASLEGTQAEMWKDQLTNHMRTLRHAMHVAYTCDRALLQEGDISGEQISSVMRLYCTNKIFRAMQETAALLLLIDGKLIEDLESDEIGRITDSFA
jgi:hypothetical protein